MMSKSNKLKELEQLESQMDLESLQASMENIKIAPSEISQETIKQCTTKMIQLMGHIHSNKKQLEEVGSNQINMYRTVSLGFQPTSNVNLIPQNRVYLPDLLKTIGVVQLGKFLVCRTLVWPFKQNAIEVIVEDGRNEELGTLLGLYNYVLDEVFEPLVLPRGSVLLLKNPWFKVTGSGGVGLRCDNPSEVELVSPVDAVAWEFCPNAEMASLCVNFMMGEPQPVVTHNWRVRGNKFFQEKNFYSAVRAYTEGLKASGSNEDSIPLWTNRAMAFLNLGRPGLALKDSEETLRLDPQNGKAIYRKAVALCRTNQHQVAMDFLRSYESQKCATTFPPDVKNLQEFIEKELQATPVTISHLSWNRKWSDVMCLPPGKTYLNHMEYTGPVTIAQIYGKGRGLVATSKIKQGDLILVSRAFDLVNLTSGEKMEICFSLDVNTKRMNDAPKMKLRASLAHRLLDEPSLRKELYRLTAGSKLGHIEIEDSPSDGAASGGGEELLLDMERIERICCLNAFGTIFDHSGIWTLPSFINHSCTDNNAGYEIHGDLMFIVALKKIKVGEELSICYLTGLETVSKAKRRERLRNSFEFDCKCRICK